MEAKCKESLEKGVQGENVIGAYLQGKTSISC